MADSESGSRLRELFFRIHAGLPREGPGNRDTTIRAFGLLAGLSDQPLILDIGAGPGRQTTDLASISNGRFIAIDTHRGYLDALHARSVQEKVSARIHPIQASMFAIPFVDGSFDAIWAEGAIYIIGFQKGLRIWRPLLRDRGYVAVTHLSWLSSDIADAPRKFWNREYPALTTIETNIDVAVGEGFDVIDHFTLPESAWWDDYYQPLAFRLATLRTEYRGDAAALSVIEGVQQEINLYRQYSGTYGYVFYVLQKAWRRRVIGL